MTRPLKVLFIWHHHQPYYKTDGTFLMPWVRMHGIKDYWDMVRMLDDYPGIRQVFNFAPSLLEQMRDYLDGTATDAAFLLSMKDPKEFSEADKLAALKTFFLANEARMIRRYPRYSELLNRRGPVRSDKDIYAVKDKFDAQDYRDLQVWWNLAWVGEYSRFDPPFRHYLDKGKGFSELEKRALLKAHRDIIARITPHHVAAAKRGQIELAVSPFYHPILPLLCDTNIAVAANARATLPEKRYRYPQDAGRQIKSALDFGRKTFGMKVSGMWPSEGSVSNAALKLISANGVSWVATDEAILQKSLTKGGKNISAGFPEKYFAYNFAGGEKPLKMFFRDHSLSDKIGFVYSGWGPDDAARDFISSLLKIRESITTEFGEAALDYAVVPVILDGENAWEFYQSDGKDFLRTLYYLLEREERLTTTLPSEVRVSRRNQIDYVEPGSWINANFDIWIGQQEDNRAWDLLHDARAEFQKRAPGLAGRKRDLAIKELMIAEGSDWCWWYGDDHKSVQAAEFDELFRYHLKQTYSLLGLAPPSNLDEPIKRRLEQLSYRPPLRAITPTIGKEKSEQEWEKAGFVEPEDPSSAMQKTGIQIRRVRFGSDRNNMYLRIETTQPISSCRLVVEFFTPQAITIEVGESIMLKTRSRSSRDQIELQYSIGEHVEIRIGLTRGKSEEAAFGVSLYDQNLLIDSLPRQGLAKFSLVSSS